MPPIFYTVTAIQGDYADLISDGGQPHSVTMFLLPEGVTVGTPSARSEPRKTDHKTNPPAIGRGVRLSKMVTFCCCGARCPFSRRSG